MLLFSSDLNLLINDLQFDNTSAFSKAKFCLKFNINNCTCLIISPYLILVLDWWWYPMPVIEIIFLFLSYFSLRVNY